MKPTDFKHPRFDSAPRVLLSPFLQSVRALRDKYSGHMFLVLVGDFYEAYFEDAIAIARCLDLVLTSKDGGPSLGARVPLAGIPQHALERYLRLLINADFWVAVCGSERPLRVSRMID
jgi:DNA mismatch repair protein MutS